jgi:hypothetical protein
MPADGEPAILRPYNAAEALTIEQAALIAGRSPRTIRDWAARFDIGRRIQGRWAISKVALAMFLDGDAVALAAYLAGDRSSPKATEYFERCGVPLKGRRTQDQLNPVLGFREHQLSELKGL